MYSDTRKPGLMTFIYAFLSLVILFCLIVEIRLHVPSEMEEETAASIRNAVRESALQCYVVEGVYPENIEYLQENYDEMENNVFVLLRLFQGLFLRYFLNFLSLT